VVSVSVLGAESRVFESRHPEKRKVHSPKEKREISKEKSLKGQEGDKTMELVFFYLFGGIGLFSALLVIMSENPVYSVLYLVLVFFNAAGLLLLLEVEFLAMIFLVVYVGAIAVLFLFVVMMLAPKITYKKEENSTGVENLGKLMSIIGFVSVLMFGFNGVLRDSIRDPNKKFNSDYRGGSSDSVLNAGTVMEEKGMLYIFDGAGVTNLESIGQVLYTYYFYYFLVAGFVLLIAMVGAIVLTLPGRKISWSRSKGQQVYEQIARDANSAIKFYA
jgi:NADH-quinone oxidoreductase subunit J